MGGRGPGDVTWLGEGGLSGWTSLFSAWDEKYAQGSRSAAQIPAATMSLKDDIVPPRPGDRGVSKPYEEDRLRL